MENKENIVVEKITENVDGITTEEIFPAEDGMEKVYTEKEFQAKLQEGIKNGIDEIMPGKIARNKAKIEKQKNREYGELVDILRTGSGMENASVGELTEALKGFYQKHGHQFQTEPKFSAEDIKILATQDANEIISAGYDEVVEEAERLNKIGVNNMSPRDKALFVFLTNHIKETEKVRELTRIGVPESVYNSQEYKDFASKFAGSNTSPKEIYEIYAKTQPKKDIQTMGSMTNSTSKDNDIKDFYTRDEALKFSVEDLRKNPKLEKVIRKSMSMWK